MLALAGCPGGGAPAPSPAPAAPASEESTVKDPAWKAEITSARLWLDKQGPKPSLRGTVELALTAGDAPIDLTAKVSIDDGKPRDAVLEDKPALDVAARKKKTVEVGFEAKSDGIVPGAKARVKVVLRDSKSGQRALESAPVAVQEVQ